MSIFAASLYVSSLAPYPGYLGNLQVAGTMTITDVSETDTTAKQRLKWHLYGLDTACTLGAADDVSNGCGIHVHTGRSCEVADHVGGHYYSHALLSDPWAPVKYVAAEALGEVAGRWGVEVVTGLSLADITGRVAVVHDASGERVACGLIQSTPCAGYSAPADNTDISGVLLAKIAGVSEDCCRLCDSFSECEGYVFHLDQCYLKKDLGATSFKQHAVTSVKVTDSCSSYAPEMKDVDMSGTLLAKVQSADDKQCCAFCNAHADCAGYVFHLDHCYLKKDLSIPNPKLGAVTRLRFGAAMEAHMDQMSNGSAMLRGSAPDHP